MSIEQHIDFAILELQRAKETFARDPDFAIGRIGEARLHIAAAKNTILVPDEPLLPGTISDRAAA